MTPDTGHAAVLLGHIEADPVPSRIHCGGHFHIIRRPEQERLKRCSDAGPDGLNVNSSESNVGQWAFVWARINPSDGSTHGTQCSP